MGKKQAGHKMNPVRKYAKLFIKALGITAGTVVAASPLIGAADDAIKGKLGFKGFSDRVQVNYGRDPSTGNIDVGKAVTSAVVLPLFGVAIMWGFNHLAKRI